MNQTAPGFKSFFSVATITILMAACSLTYELILAQTLTAMFGGAVLRYSMVIGLYLMGLGLGALYFEKYSENVVQRFFNTQLILSFLGSLGFVSLILISVWQYQFPWFVFLYAHGLIVVIGFFSGLEIPLMNALNKNKFTQTLSLDYLGGLIGSVCFPLIFYPQFGLIVTALIAALVNLILCLWIAISFNKSKLIQFLLLGLIVGLISLILKQDIVVEVLQNIYITGNFNAA